MNRTQHIFYLYKRVFSRVPVEPLAQYKFVCRTIKRDEISGKSANEPESGSDFKLRFLERDLNLFTKTKRERKRIDVCLKKVEDKDESRYVHLNILPSFGGSCGSIRYLLHSK